MAPPSPRTLDTPRLRLRAPRPDDLDALTEIWTDSEVARLLISRPRSRAEVAEKLEALIEHARGFGMWIVELRETGAVIGRCGFYPYEGEGRLGPTAEPELAFLLARAHWGRGLASEAAHAALTALFEQRGAPRALALVRPEHAASRRVLAKLGMREQQRVLVNAAEALLYASPARGGSS